MTIRLLEPWRTRLLWLSLGLNLFAAALIAAPHVWRRHPPGPPSFEMIIDRLARDLPAADALLFRNEMANEHGRFDTGRRHMDESREVLAQSVAKEPFDPVATGTALAAMQDRMREMGVRFNESLVMAIAKLSPEGRAKLGQSLRNGRP